VGTVDAASNQEASSRVVPQKNTFAIRIDAMTGIIRQPEVLDQDFDYVIFKDSSFQKGGTQWESVDRKLRPEPGLFHGEIMAVQVLLSKRRTA